MDISTLPSEVKGGLQRPAREAEYVSKAFALAEHIEDL